MPELTLTETELIDRLRERARSPKTASDDGLRPAAPAVPPAQVEAAEQRLGVALPALLREIYLTVAAGGIGPGGGLHGIPEALLPGRLYPLCDWGTGIASALDITTPDAPVVRVDPNMPKADVSVRIPAALHFDRAAAVKAACWVESPSFEQWLTDWLDGQPLFYAAYRGAESEDEDEDSDEEDGED